MNRKFAVFPLVAQIQSTYTYKVQIFTVLYLHSAPKI